MLNKNFFFNKSFNKFIYSKMVKNFLSNKYILRNINKRKNLILIDTFQIFFKIKLNKNKQTILLNKNVNNFKNFLLLKKNFFNNLIGTTVYFDLLHHIKNKYFLSNFFYFKQKLFVSNKFYLFNFWLHLFSFNNLQKSILFIKTSRILKGLLKYYFNNILIYKFNFRKKHFNYVHTNSIITFSKPLFINNSYSLVKIQNFLLKISKNFLFGFLKLSINTCFIEIKPFVLLLFYKKNIKKNFKHLLFFNNT